MSDAVLITIIICITVFLTSVSVAGTLVGARYVKDLCGKPNNYKKEK